MHWLVIFSALILTIIVPIRERYARTGAVKMAFVREEFATVYPDFLEMTVPRLFVQLISIIIQKIIHVGSRVHLVLIKTYFHGLVSPVIVSVRNVLMSQQYAVLAIQQSIILRFFTKEFATVTALSEHIRWEMYVLIAIQPQPCARHVLVKQLTAQAVKAAQY